MVNRRFHQAFVAIICLGLFARPAALLAESPRLGTAADDVVLQPDGLAIKTINAAGQPLAARRVTLSRGGDVIAEGLSDAAGVFRARGVRAGAYQVSTAGSQRLVRVWTEQAAPPAARTELTLLDGPEVIRGQQERPRVIATPLILGGIVAAVIAVALGLDGDDNDDAS